MFSSLTQKLLDLKQNVSALVTAMVERSYLCASRGSACFQSQKASDALPKKIYLAMLPAVYCRRN
jgi:hypothetical protein